MDTTQEMVTFHALVESGLSGDELRLTCYQATIEWQNLPLSIRQPMPKNIFKRHLNEYFLDRTFNN